MEMKYVLVCLVTFGFTEAYHVVCFYDSRSILREGPGKIMPNDIEPLLENCTHLVYGYAKIDSSRELAPLDASVDLPSGMNNYRKITSLKTKNPQLKVLLSVGGEADSSDRSKYSDILLDSDDRSNFVQSVRKFLLEHNFDGLDLFWNFPSGGGSNTGILDSLWQGLKDMFGYTEEYKAKQRREGFTELVKELRKSLEGDRLLLTATFSPIKKQTVNVEPESLAKYLEQIHLRAFDFTHPEKSHNYADYPAALGVASPRDPLQSARGQVLWWLERKVPKSKIILGIPTFGRAWRLGRECTIFGEPPIPASGPANGGPHTKTPGLLSYSEICLLQEMPLPESQALHVVSDPSRLLGPYAFRQFRDSIDGIWVGYTDPDTVVFKTEYVKNNTLGGVAFWDISLDDFRGTCTGVRYPIIQASIHSLKQKKNE